MSISTPLKTTTLARIFCFIVIVAWSISHVPFLSADADHHGPQQSRGSWTDEGLYAGQIRNYLNNNQFNILESDALIKTPLYSACLVVPFKVFETSQEVARASVVCIVMLSLLLFVFFQHFRLALILFLSTTLLFFSVREYSHLSLPEMCAVAMILIAGLAFVQHQKTKQYHFITACFIFLFAAVLFKVQFIYLLVIPSVCIFLANAYERKKIVDKSFFTSLLYVIGIIGLLYGAFYLPLKNEFDFIATMQSGTYTMDTISYDYFKQNIEYKFFDAEHILFTSCFLLALVIALWSMIKKSIPESMSALMLFTFVWILVELHKLPMSYLPVRYLISTYVAMGLFTSLTFAHVFTTKCSWVLKTSIAVLIIVLVYTNTKNYIDTYNRRTFAIAQVNAYLAATATKNKIMIGPWAPTLTWQSKSISFPIWKDFLTTKTPLKTFKPSVVISEYNEDDSGEAYRNLGINLAACSDSIKEVSIAYWKINIYWINQDSLK